MHASTGRWQLGLALALTTAVFWGLLPIALKVTLAGMDAWTLTWYRFTTAAIAHLAHSTPEEFRFTSTDFNSYVTISTADGAPRREQGFMSASTHRCSCCSGACSCSASAWPRCSGWGSRRW